MSVEADKGGSRDDTGRIEDTGREKSVREELGRKKSGREDSGQVHEIMNVMAVKPERSKRSGKSRAARKTAPVAAEALEIAPVPAAPAVPRAAPGWPERVMEGNALVASLFAERVAEVGLADPLDYDSAPYLLAPWEGATKLLITFGGNTGYLMLPPPVVTAENTHVLAFRDPKRCFGLCGLPVFGSYYWECLDNITLLIQALGVKEVYCAGVSAGGFPAMRFALDLEAQGVLAFSTPTTLDLADDPDAPMSRYPQLAALYRRKPDVPLDLARAYRETPVRPRAVLLFSPSNERDSWLAERMAGIEGVQLERVSPEADHRVFFWLNSTHGIQRYFDTLFRLRRLEVEEERPGALPLDQAGG